jgi:hypothetical protein
LLPKLGAQFIEPLGRILLAGVEFKPMRRGLLPQARYDRLNFCSQPLLLS